MLVWCLHDHEPKRVLAKPRDNGFWYIPALKSTKDGSELFRTYRGLLKFVRRREALKNKIPYLRLIQGGKVVRRHER